MSVLRRKYVLAKCNYILYLFYFNNLTEVKRKKLAVETA